MAEDPTEISFAELRAAAAQILDAAERRFGPQLQLDTDYYRLIHGADAFNFESEPQVLSGQLSDDIASVRELLKRDDPDEDELLVWHDLDHLTGILRRIAHLAGA